MRSLNSAPELNLIDDFSYFRRACRGQGLFGVFFNFVSARANGEKCKQTGRVAVCTCRIDFGEQRFHICFRELPGNIGMTAVAGDSRNQEDGAARWQLVRKRNCKRLLHQFRISRAGERVVVILFFFDARRFQAELMQFVPNFLVGVVADNYQNWRTQIGCERRRSATNFSKRSRQLEIISGSFKCPRALIKLARRLPALGGSPALGSQPSVSKLGRKAIGHACWNFSRSGWRSTGRSMTSKT